MELIKSRIPLPKTKAGHFKLPHWNSTVIREKLTSYGSSAIIRTSVCNYHIIFWDITEKITIFTNCYNNLPFLYRLWNEII